jgi:DNA-directed RNA polymerase specialized sigma24 family protein
VRIGWPSRKDYRRGYARLVGLAHGLSGSRTAAEELVQEAFLAAHRRRSDISRYDDPAAWVGARLPRNLAGVRALVPR